MDYFGVIPSPPDDRDYPVTAIAPAVALPEAVRLDNRIMGVLNQFYCGICVGKGCNAILSAGYKTQLSSLYIYARCKLLDGIPGKQGTYPRIALKVIKDYGSCPNYLLPYSSLKSCTRMPFLTQEMDVAAARYKIIAYARVFTVSEIKQALAAGHMVGIALWLDDEFKNYKGKGSIKPVAERQGLHWVGLCGYDDSLNAFRGVNSWGENWGDKGFFWLDYSTIAVDMQEGWAVEVTAEQKTSTNMLADLLRNLLNYLQGIRLWQR